jgi:hypothetical protein
MGAYRCVATSTREMGPGSREDILNCHWNFWNWQKLIGLGASQLSVWYGRLIYWVTGERLRTRMDCAKQEYVSQLEGFT